MNLELREEHEKHKRLAAELNSLTSALPTDELLKENCRLEAELEEKRARLGNIKEGQVKLVDKTEKINLDHESKNLAKRIKECRSKVFI